MIGTGVLLVVDATASVEKLEDLYNK